MARIAKYLTSSVQTPAGNRLSQRRKNVQTVSFVLRAAESHRATSVLAPSAGSLGHSRASCAASSRLLPPEHSMLFARAFGTPLRQRSRSKPTTYATVCSSDGSETLIVKVKVPSPRKLLQLR